MAWLTEQNAAGFTHPPIIRRQTVARAEGETGQIEPARLVHGSTRAAGLHFDERFPQTSQERCRPVAAIGSYRRDWPASLLRRLWEALVEVEAGRTRTAMHEARWLNLAGFSLRPGYGLAADDWRVSETRRILLGKPGHSTPACLSERWILWRRICGGLPSGQQRALADTVLPQLRDMAAGPVSKRTSGTQASSHKSAEMWRLLGALELLPVKTKIAVGEMIVETLV